MNFCSTSFSGTGVLKINLSVISNLLSLNTRVGQMR